ncbi:MAG: MOSC domain-containing protein [Planctomycetota bacterium]|jgi:MOSC domain-containing protein YiiM
MSTRLHSLQVALPEAVAVAEGTLRTGMRKTAVSGPVFLGLRALDGDGCADLEHHGLEEQAVCVMPRKHYAFWREELGLSEQEFPLGSFGDNFTVDGQTEEDIRIGDRWRIGEAEVEVTMPRAPCSTLNRVWGNRQFAAIMGRRGITGWYLRVLRPGMVEAGVEMELLERDPEAPTVAEAWRRGKEDSGG